MSCCQCQGIENFFDKKTAEKELKSFQKKGPSKETKILIDALKKLEIKNLSLLDVGAGIGAIEQSLLTHGIKNAIDVDASTGFIEVAKTEAQKNNVAEKIKFINGDFVSIANEIEVCDIVTLDKVICCFDEMEKLVTLSAEKSKKYYALVYPKDKWWTKTGQKTLNFIFMLFGKKMRTFIHPTKKVDEILKNKNFENIFYQTTTIWQIFIYENKN